MVGLSGGRRGKTMYVRCDYRTSLSFAPFAAASKPRRCIEQPLGIMDIFQEHPAQKLQPSGPICRESDVSPSHRALQ